MRKVSPNPGEKETSPSHPREGGLSCWTPVTNRFQVWNSGLHAQRHVMASVQLSSLENSMESS